MKLIYKNYSFRKLSL